MAIGVVTIAGSLIYTGYKAGKAAKKGDEK